MHGFTQPKYEPTWLERLIFGRDCMYREGRIGYWKVRQVERYYEDRTPWGFQVYRKLTCFVSRVDNDEFNEARMLEDGKAETVVDRWFTQIFGRVVDEERAFVSLGFANLGFVGCGHPTVWHYRVRRQNGRDVVEFDPNGCGIVKAANAATEAAAWRHNGCEVELILSDVGVFKEDSVENHRMLTPEMIAAAESDERVSIATEAGAVYVMKKRQEFLEAVLQGHRDQRVSNGDLVVETKGVGNAQKLWWEKHGGIVGSGWEVVGFREEGGFSDDPYSDEVSRSRVRVAHSTLKEGETGEHLQAGRTYYYTFYVRHTQTGHKQCWLRFSVRVPTSEEQAADSDEMERIRRFTERLTAAATPKEPKVEEGDEEVRRMKSAFWKRVKVDDAMHDVKKEYRERLKAQGVDEDDVKRRLARLEADILRNVHQ